MKKAHKSPPFKAGKETPNASGGHPDKKIPPPVKGGVPVAQKPASKKR